MSRVCLGCGIPLQSINTQEKGYVLSSKLGDAIYCQRCYRLKHYHEKTFDALSFSNEKILEQAKKYQAPVYYFVDLLHLSDYAMQYFKQISTYKVLVLTKVDLLSFSVSLERLQKRIQELYGIQEEIICLSNKRPKMISTLWNHMCKQPSKKAVFLGMTNVGKSSFLNELFKLVFLRDAEVLVSEMPNTTQNFLTWDLKDFQVIDAPGFAYPKNNMFIDSVMPKKFFHPVTLPMKPETFLLLEDFLAFQQDLEQNSITFYGSELLSLKRVYRCPYENCQTTNVTIPAFSDFVILGVGFFYFKKKTELTILSREEVDFEIRPSLFGGHYDSN